MQIVEIGLLSKTGGKSGDYKEWTNDIEGCSASSCTSPGGDCGSTSEHGVWNVEGTLTSLRSIAKTTTRTNFLVRKPSRLLAKYAKSESR